MFKFHINSLPISFQNLEVVEWSARLARKRAFRVGRLLASLSMMHILL